MQKSCLHCGGLFVATANSKRYCSAECRPSFPQYARKASQALCENCGVLFTQDTSAVGRARRFCTKECHGRFWDRIKTERSRERLLRYRITKVRTIKSAANFRFKVPSRKLLPIRGCKTCRTAFLSDGDTRTVFCSDACRTALHDFKRNSLRRSAVESGECFPAAEIFARDGWMCALCGESIDKRLRHPHRMAATVDHIIPLSRGGTHTRDNVQAAHKSCNCRKGNRIAGTNTEAYAS